MKELFPIKRFDRVEFYVGNAKQAATFYAKCFGFTNTAYRGLETGSRDVASYVMEQGKIRFVFSSSLRPDHPISQSVLRHGDSVAILALEVTDVDKAHWETTSRGAIEVIPPTEESDEYGVLRYSAIRAYGDVSIEFVDRSSYEGVFAPGFQLWNVPKCHSCTYLDSIDHIVANVEFGAMDRWVKFFAETMGFDLLAHFDDRTIATEFSALTSKVVQDSTGTIKLPINEPAYSKRKSQIEEYLDYHSGPGVQHIALSTKNIIESVRQLKAAGVQFLEIPEAYYLALEQRVGPIHEPIEILAELGILVDRNEDGYLLQIFTQTLQDRPTLFFEIIQRHGAQGFGEGNFKALFEAIEREQAMRGNLL